MLAIAGQLLTLYSDSDLSTPIGRFRTMTDGLAHLAPILGASALLLAGSWNSGVRGRRNAIALWIGFLMLVALFALTTVIPDAGKLSTSVIPSEWFRYQSQVIRSIIYLLGSILALGVALWRFLTRMPLKTGE
jgi:hypothetical protein